MKYISYIRIEKLNDMKIDKSKLFKRAHALVKQGMEFSLQTALRKCWREAKEELEQAKEQAQYEKEELARNMIPEISSEMKKKQMYDCMQHAYEMNQLGTLD